MKALILIALLAGPAAAQGFYGNLAGSRYCQLRRIGVTHDQALTAAIKENWSDRRRSVTVMVSGNQVSTDMIDMAEWVSRCQ
jgi:hypothetical protein